MLTMQRIDSLKVLKNSKESLTIFGERERLKFCFQIVGLKDGES